LYKNRCVNYRKLESMLGTNLLVYVTGDRAGMETQIAQDVIDIFIDHLDRIGVIKKLTLYLYTRGGDLGAAWNIVNLIKHYCDEFEVIVPHKAHSAGTLISIGANDIIMTKQATLGPIDPSINTPLNPINPMSPNQRIPVSVEAVKGYLAFAKEELGIKDDDALANLMIKLSETVHPLVLGQVYRSRSQIKMLAEKLLTSQIKDQAKIQHIISFLCSDSGSHDYTIHRREAKDDLGLNIIKPTQDLYKIIKDIYDDINAELEFNHPFNAQTIIKDKDSTDFVVKRCLVESTKFGSDYLVTKGRISKKIIPPPVIQLAPGMPFPPLSLQNLPTQNKKQVPPQMPIPKKKSPDIATKLVSTGNESLEINITYEGWEHEKNTVQRKHKK